MEFEKNQYKIHSDIRVNIIKIKEILGKSDDIVFRDIEISNQKQTKALLCYVSGLTNTDMISQHIIKALTQNINTEACDVKSASGNTFESIKNNILSIADLDETQSMRKIVEEILSGKTALFIDTYVNALVINALAFEARNVQDPGSETVVRGPREGFTENIAVNVALVRRKVKNPNLILQKIILGRQTNTTIFIAYMDKIANPKIVQEVKERINRIQIDSILESGSIEQLIEDNPTSIFPTVGNSEKPDVIAAKLLEGRVAIFCDGTPFVLTVPFLFIESLQTAEDYYSRPFIATVLRIIRVVSLFTTIAAPALYVAVTVFHYEMIPTVLLITTAASREGIPFPPVIEAFLMGIVFEILREAGIRMPRPVGQATSIVGALVLGEAAVNAGIVSSPMIIIVAFTGITDFVNPALISITFYLRTFLLVMSTGLGLYGILIGFFFILAHMCSLRSFGTPFLTPLAPTIWSELKDTVVRSFLWLMQSRPQSITWKKSQRQGLQLKPGPQKPNRR
jgi:spore germination protein KA